MPSIFSDLNDFPLGIPTISFPFTLHTRLVNVMNNENSYLTLTSKHSDDEVVQCPDDVSSNIANAVEWIVYVGIAARILETSALSLIYFPGLGIDRSLIHLKGS